MTGINGVTLEKIKSFGKLIADVRSKLDYTSFGRFAKNNVLILCFTEYAVNIIDGNDEYLFSIKSDNENIEVQNGASKDCRIVFDIKLIVLDRILRDEEYIRVKHYRLFKYFFQYIGSAKLLDEASLINELRGERVALRRYKESELQQILLWYMDRDLNRLAGFAYNEPNISKVRSNMLSAFGKDPMNLVIEYLETGEAIGTIQLYDINRYDGNCMLGIRIGSKDYQGKGLGTEAIMLLVNHAFKDLNLKRVSLKVYDYNEYAIKCYLKTGFEVEGHLRKSAKVEGVYYDEVLMSIINQE